MFEHSKLWLPSLLFLFMYSTLSTYVPFGEINLFLGLEETE